MFACNIIKACNIKKKSMLLCLSLCDMVTKDKIIQLELQNMAGCASLPAGNGDWWLSV